MPIGGVLAGEGVVIPHAVGVDIGCGMCAVRTSLTGITTDRLKRVMAALRKRIPLGFKHHKKPCSMDLMPPLPDDGQDGHLMPVVAREFERARYQIGTPGGW